MLLRDTEMDLQLYNGIVRKLSGKNRLDYSVKLFLFALIFYREFNIYFTHEDYQIFCDKIGIVNDRLARAYIIAALSETECKLKFLDPKE